MNIITKKNVTNMIWYLIGSLIIPFSFGHYFYSSNNEGAYLLFILIVPPCPFILLMLLHFSVQSFWSKSKKAQIIGLLASIFILLIPTGLAIILRAEDRSFVTPVTFIMLLWVTCPILYQLEQDKTKTKTLCRENPKLLH